MSRALESANLAAPPATARDVIVFARTYLVTILRAELGPPLAGALIDELLARLTPPMSAPPPVSMRRPIDHEQRAAAAQPTRATPSAIARAVVRPTKNPCLGVSVSVLLVDADRIGRAVLSRSLLRGSCDVTVVASVDDVRQALLSEDRFDVAIVDGRDPLLWDVLRALVAARPGLPVVARAESASRADALLRAAGVERFDVHQRDASADTLVRIVRGIVAKP